MSMLDEYLQFLEHTYSSYEEIFVWLGVFSLVLFIVSIIVIPVIVKHIPEDYFINPKYQTIRLQSIKDIIVFIIRNILGIILILLGIIMLITPGQGLISIIIGIILMQFKGKYILEQKLIANATVIKSINWIRAKMHTSPIKTELNHN